MLECPGCGARNADNTSFCVRCGSPMPGDQTVAFTPSQVQGSGDLLDEAAELYAAGQLDAAAATCHAALDADPDSIAARSLLGMVEEERGNLAAALAEYEAVIRLAPERTAERERADRLRAKIRAQRGPAIPEGAWTPAHRRWIPIAASAGVACLVLIVGAIFLSGRQPSANAPQLTAGLGLQPALPAANAVVEPLLPAPDQPTTAELQAGPGWLSEPIGEPPPDQSANQPQPATTTRESEGSPPSSPAVDASAETPLPPPVVNESKPATVPSPLKLPQPSKPAAATGPPAPASSQSSSVKPSRGGVRIWVGEDQPQTAETPPDTAHTESQYPPWLPPSPAQSFRAASGTSAIVRGPRTSTLGSPAAASPPSRSGAAERRPLMAGGRPGLGPSGASGLATPASGTRASQIMTGRSTPSLSPSAVATRPATSTGISRAPVRQSRGFSAPSSAATTVRSSGAAASARPAESWTGGGPGGVSARPAPTRHAPSSPSWRPAAPASSARTTAPTGSSTASALRPPASEASAGLRTSTATSEGLSGPSGPARRQSADEVRARAQEAWASGRTEEARAGYRAAIKQYEDEARANPGRAAASRSAIDSCRRALEALDGG